MLGTVIVVGLVVFLIAALFPGVANVTTGITIPHSRFNNATITFTPSANITGSPGLGASLPLIPLFFAFVGLLYAAKVLHKESAGI